MVILNNIKPSWRRGAETLTFPTLIITGADTGNTRVMTFNMAHMPEMRLSLLF